MISQLFKALFSQASFGNPNGMHITGPAIFVFPASLALIYCFFASIRWVYRDGERRDKSGPLAIIYILVTGWPFSLVWWWWLRPAPAVVHVTRRPGSTA